MRGELIALAARGLRTPLAHLIGMEGLALLRAFTGEHDRDFVEARLAEVRRLLEDEHLAASGTAVDRLDARTGYRAWAPAYDEPGNALLELEGPVVRGHLDALPPGVSLDAVCGTGRHAAHLAARGHVVIGVDDSPEMLARARERLPDAEFRLGDREALPVEPDSVDAVVCALALTHLPIPDRAIAEFVRVLRPRGGQLVCSDIHHERILWGSVPPVVTARRAGSRRTALRRRLPPPGAARGVPGQSLRIDPLAARGQARGPPEGPEPWHTWPWSLSALIPEAARAADDGVPAFVVRHFELTRA